MKALQAAASASVSADVLGYRAARVELQDADGTAVFLFSGETVAVMRTGQETYYKDPAGRRIVAGADRCGACGGSLAEAGYGGDHG